jgi:hypothetical protein
VVGWEFLVVALAAVGVGVYLSRRRAAARDRELADARFEAARWVERLGGQLLNLEGTDAAAKQALADAAERYNAAGSQLDQARGVVQCRQVVQTAAEGLYYIRAARVAMGLDPGPELPPLPGQERAGRVTESRDVEVEGHHYSAAPTPSARTAHYYPGGTVSGRPVPAGWYSEPWWKTALVAGAWGVGSFLLFDALFDGMAGSAYADGVHDVQALGGGDDPGENILDAPGGGDDQGDWRDSWDWGGGGDDW